MNPDQNEQRPPMLRDGLNIFVKPMEQVLLHLKGNSITVPVFWLKASHLSLAIAFNDWGICTSGP